MVDGDAAERKIGATALPSTAFCFLQAALLAVPRQTVRPVRTSKGGSWRFRFRRRRCHKAPALQLRPRHNAAGVSFLNRYRGEIRRVLSLVIEGSGHAHRTAGGEIGLRAFLQAAGKLAVTALHRDPCLMIAGTRLQNQKGCRADTLELLLIEVIQLHENNGGGMVRPEDDIVLAARG
jgi:hypothetical protein